MHAFKDTEGRNWLVSISVQSIKMCRALVDVDLYSLVDDKFQGLEKLFSDPVKFVDVLYVLCKPEADGRGLSDEDFGRSMGGDSLGKATDAFLEELTDFFPDPRIRGGLKKVMETSRKLKGIVLERTDKQLDKALNEIDLEAAATKLIESFGNSPGYSVSTPDPSLSENSI